VAVFGERRGDRRVLAGQAGSPVRSGPAQPGGQGGIAEHRAHRVGQTRRVARRNENRGVFPGQFGVPADAGRHDGHPGPERLLQDERLPLPHAGQYEDVRGGQQGRHVGALAGEPDREPERGRAGSEFGRERSLAGDDEQRLRLDVTPAGGGIEQETEALLRGQPTDGEHEGLAGAGPEFGADRRARFRGNITSRRDAHGGHDRVADPPGARSAHPVFQVAGHAQH
jgi:hypothetical protein